MSILPPVSGNLGTASRTAVKAQQEQAANVSKAAEEINQSFNQAADVVAQENQAAADTARAALESGPEKPIVDLLQAKTAYTAATKVQQVVNDLQSETAKMLDDVKA